MRKSILRSVCNNAAPLWRAWWLFLACFAAWSVVLGDEDVPIQKFESDYRTALKRLQAEQAPVRLKGKVSEVMDRKDGKPLIRDRVYDMDYLSDGGPEKLVAVFHDKGYLEIVTVRGERTFSLTRESRESPFILDQLNNLANSYLDAIKESKTMFVNASFSVGNEFVPALMKAGQFHARKVTRLERAGKPLIRVEFDYQPKNKNQERDMKGWMLLDESRGWAVVEHEVRRKTLVGPPEERIEEVVSGKVLYSDEEGCALLPKEVTISLLMLPPNGKKFERRYSFQADQCSTKPISPTEFTLDAYGMGDVARPSGGSNNRFAFWAFGFAAVAIAASLVLRRLGRS